MRAGNSYFVSLVTARGVEVVDDFARAVLAALRAA